MESPRSESINEEAHHLLYNDEKTDFLEKKWKPKFSKYFISYVVLLHVVLIALVVARIWPQHIDTGSWSPIEKYLKYRLQDTYTDNSAYAGNLSTESTAAWDELTKPIYFNLSRKDIEKAGIPSHDRTKLNSGEYMATLSVFHELHCLQQFRFFIYMDYYDRDMPRDKLEHIQEHLDHCLGWVRSSLMCHPNTKLLTFKWNDLTAEKPDHESHANSQCVDWSSVQAWQKSVNATRSPHFRRIAPGKT